MIAVSWPLICTVYNLHRTAFLTIIALVLSQWSSSSSTSSTKGVRCFGIPPPVIASLCASPIQEPCTNTRDGKRVFQIASKTPFRALAGSTPGGAPAGALVVLSVHEQLQGAGSRRRPDLSSTPALDTADTRITCLPACWCGLLWSSTNDRGALHLFPLLCYPRR